MFKYKYIDKICYNEELTEEIKKAEKWFIDEKYISGEFVDYENKCLYVLDDGKIISFIVYTCYKTHTRLHLIYVNKSYRGQGLLKKLIKKIDGKIFEWGASIHNLNAIVAYAKLGAILKKQKFNTEMVECTFIPKKRKKDL